MAKLIFEPRFARLRNLHPQHHAFTPVPVQDSLSPPNLKQSGHLSWRKPGKFYSLTGGNQLLSRTTAEQSSLSPHGPCLLRLQVSIHAMVHRPVSLARKDRREKLGSNLFLMRAGVERWRRFRRDHSKGPAPPSLINRRARKATKARGPLSIILSIAGINTMAKSSLRRKAISVYS